MEERKELQGLHRFLQFAVYVSLALDVLIFIGLRKVLFLDYLLDHGFETFISGLKRLEIYQQPIFSRAFTMLLLLLTSIGTLAKKDKDLSPKNSILYPLSLGLILFFCTLWLYGINGTAVFFHCSFFEICYLLALVSGTMLMHVALDNISKIISSKLGKDKWNVEGESFMQQTKAKISPYSVNIPSLFYFKGRIRSGWINMENIFRGTLLIGTPGSGKSFGVVIPFIRQLMAKDFCICLYDFKFPDLAQVAWYHYKLARRQGRMQKTAFHVINLTHVEKSRRINVLRTDYILSLADASETAEALVEALKKGDKSGGSDQFFTQSAVNFLSACIFFFSRYQQGKYSTLAHVLSFLNCSYEQIFAALFSNAELSSLLSPFMTAYKAKAYDQLEGQVGTLKVFISRLATKEMFWVFSGDDFNLKISDPEQPSILVLANDPNTQNINSACYSVVVNRLTRLINSKGNLPSALLLDELPTIFVHRIENLIATARSNKVAVLMGLQELPQFQQQYGKEVSATITAVVGNVLSGAVRNKETLEWLERLFGKVKQQGESLSIDRTKVSLSLNERLEPLIPAGKIAALRAGELVGMLAADAVAEYNGVFEPSAIHCKINLDLKAIASEEALYTELPDYYDFGGKKQEILVKNFDRINQEVSRIAAAF